MSQGRDPDAVVLKPLQALDLAVAAALHAGSFDDAWGEKAIGELLAIPGSFGSLASIDDQPVGFVLALATGPDVEILTLAVSPRYRRRGVARCLLAWVDERACAAGCERVVLDVAEDNKAAYSLYRRLGFMDIARRPAYYRRSAGAAVTAIVLARLLRKKEEL